MRAKEEKKNEQVCKNVFEIIQNSILSDNPSASKFCVDVAAEWLSCYDDCLYLGCENNKIGDSLVAIYHHDTIYLLGDAYKTIMYAPKLMFHFVGPTHIHIDDVLMKHNDVGNGSIAMCALLRYAHLHNVEQITGYLSPVDEGHQSRRNHFYKKFGFEIEKDRISKILKKG